MFFNYKIFKTFNPDLPNAVSELLSLIPRDTFPVRLIFFGKSLDNTAYISDRNSVITSVSKFYGPDNRPLVTYVAQAPVDASLYMECHLANRDKMDTIQFKHHEDVEYVVINATGNRLLLTEGILPSSLNISMKDQALEVFDKLGAVLRSEGFPISSIDRQWNYIENIVAEKDSGFQNYQQLNDARSIFYSKTSWPNGYPAATGIGTQAGGIMVEADAAYMGTMLRVPIDNEMQVAAHAYSSDVLVGIDARKTTPKFERAKAVINNKSDKLSDIMIYVSGTAAIRGEESLIGVGIEKQTITTLENIEYLISKTTLSAYNIVLDKDIFVTTFRVYLKRIEDFEPAKRIISSRYPDTQTLYVLCDVCRDELLIEIEGTVEVD